MRVPVSPLSRRLEVLEYGRTRKNLGEHARGTPLACLHRTPRSISSKCPLLFLLNHCKYRTAILKADAYLFALQEWPLKRVNLLHLILFSQFGINLLKRTLQDALASQEEPVQLLLKWNVLGGYMGAHPIEPKYYIPLILSRPNRYNG